MITVHFNNGRPDVGVANATEAGPLGYKLPNATEDTVFRQVWELRNSSQPVGYFMADQVDWLEPAIA